MMRSNLASACVLAAFAILVSCYGGCPDGPGVYCDRENGFHITFPEDWTIDEDPGGGRIVAALAPLEEGTDPLVKGTSFEVKVMRLQSNPDLEKFFEGYMQKLPEGKPYYQYEDSGEIKVGGRKTKYILYAIDTEPRIEARLEYFQKKGSAIYIFRGVTRGVQFGEFHDKFREIAYTFRLM
jgi:hypothetical protein